MASTVPEAESAAADGSIRHTPSLCSLNFPRPHRLGVSSGIHPSHSSLASLPHPPPVAPPSTTIKLARATPKYVPEVLESFPAKSQAVEEVDSGAPPSKRFALASRKHEPIVKTFNEEALREFVLYLPPRLPMTIVSSRLALVEFVQQTALTYLSLWELSPSLTLLDLRFPPSYSESLSDDPHFIHGLLESVFEQLDQVRSIKEAYLPQIVFHASTQLEVILGSLGKTKCAISHLFLPIKCSLKVNEVENVDYKSVAAFLHKTKVRELTFVSSSEAVEDIKERLQSELKKVSRKNTVKLHFSDHVQSEPGPAYISELGQEGVVGEMVDPLSLVSSLNTPLSGGGGGSQPLSSGSCTQHIHKIPTRGAFTTDCTYSEEAELNADGPFASRIWNLDRLHAEGCDGTGTTIAVIDSGINYTHPAFKDRVVAVRNFVPEEIDDIDCVIDSDGHGTHCTGIAAGSAFYCPLNASKPDSPCVVIPPGVAPGAKLVICKVVRTTTGEVDSPAFLNALKWIKQLHMEGNQIDVVSISLASTYYSHERAQVISELTSRGVIVVCCASNVGRLRLQPISFPARLGHVLCIGAHDENGKPTSFSPVGRELDFLAPGDDLWGPGPGTVGPFAMDCASGTSCATPTVAGLICLILQAVSNICEEERDDPDVSMIGGRTLIEVVHNVWVMRELLKEMSSSPGHHSEEIGYGTLNPYRVLDRSAAEIRRIINEIVEDE